MKIVFVCDTLGPGGAERVISSLSNEFSQRGHDVTIIMLSSLADTPFYPLETKIQLAYLHDKNIKRMSPFSKLKLLRINIIKEQPDIVISFLSYVCIYTWLALRKTKIPFIVSERNDPNQRKFLKQLLLNLSFRKASGCVFQTYDALKWYGNKVSEKSLVIYNPVQLTYLPSDNFIRKKQILYVGRLSEQKNVLMLIQSFKLFLEDHDDYILKIIGSGPLKNKLLDEVNKKRLDKNVILCPNSKEWQRDEYNSSLFVLPSNFEGMPNVLAEALCLGMPAVSTNCTIGGPKELKRIFPNQLILSKVGDPISFADAMAKALSNASNNIGVPDKLSINTICNKWICFIENLVLNNNK